MLLRVSEHETKVSFAYILNYEGNVWLTSWPKENIQHESFILK